ncbi:MAG: MarR family winged helix-turn-helix transcriptional regulator [Pseudomonadota bacterium]|nr:MarR family winged helix-turn-helix transcriptional regulator [Pseudomonadota bacterium]
MSNTSLSPQTVSPEATPGALIPSLINITKYGRALLDLQLQEISFRSGQDHILMTLEPDGDPVLVSHIANKVGVRDSTVSKMLDRLENRGLVHRGADESDRRHTTVVLTSEGKTVRKDVQMLWENIEAYILKNHAAEADELRRGTAELDKLLTQRLGRLR